MTIRKQIIEANKAYRLGRPVMTDQAFDDLCEAYEKTVSPEECAAFREPPRGAGKKCGKSAKVISKMCDKH